MVTKFFLSNTASGLDTNPWSGTNDEELVASLTAGSGLSTGTTDTVASGTQVAVTRDTTGDVAIVWWSNPLSAVVISGTVTLNFWMSESNMSANVGARVSIFRYSGDGLTLLGNLSSSEKGIELPVTTRAAQNWTFTPSSVTLVDGDRLLVVVQGAGVGTMSGGFTFNLGFSGPTGAADGDSWVQFTEAITEFVAPAATSQRPIRQVRQAISRSSIY